VGKNGIQMMSKLVGAEHGCEKFKGGGAKGNVTSGRPSH
jgi:hypothetical protein